MSEPKEIEYLERQSYDWQQRAKHLRMDLRKTVAATEAEAAAWENAAFELDRRIAELKKDALRIAEGGSA